jgi:chromosome segregation ATPase
VEKRKLNMTELETEVELLKKELGNQKKIHDRLDVAIEKLTDVSNSINRMLAVHEEKLTKQEEAIIDAEQQIEIRRSELSKQIADLHSRLTTTTKEIVVNTSTQHAQQNKEIQRIKDDILSRVGVLEKWRHVLIGGAIVIGFILHRVVNFNSL